MKTFWLAVTTFAALLVAAASPALAHEEHRKMREQAAQLARSAPQAGVPAAANVDPNVMHAQMGGMMESASDRRSKMTTFDRFLDWLGRLHPMIVHFPIAFFPAALFGWFDGGFNFSADDAMLGPHRWLGTGVGVGALGLGIWAWRRPEDDRGLGMIIGLTVITAAIVVQGWFGGALVHGIDHMNW